MFIRVYFEGHSKDIDLQNCNQFSIGNSSNDNCVITNADLVARHAVITNNNGKFELSCNGTIYLNGTVVKNAELKPSQIYILSRTYKISMLVIADYAKDGIEIDLSKPQIRIGRENNNDITLNSPIISSSHAVIRKNGSDLIVQDQNSMNGTYVNGNLVHTANLNNGDEIVIGDCKLIYNNGKLYIYGNVSNVIKNKHTENISDQSDKVMFKRSPRLKLDVPTGKIEIQSPPNKITKPEINWLSVLLPSLGTATVFLVLTILTGMSPTMLAFTLPMSIIGIVISVVNYNKQSKKYKSQDELRSVKYDEHLKSIVSFIEEKRDEQIAALNLSDPHTSDCFKIVENLEPRLWNRRPSDSDFVSVRIGSGKSAFSMQISAPRTVLSLEEDPLSKKPQEIYEKYNTINNIPITTSLVDYPVLGVAGEHNTALKLIANIVVQIATHYCYTEVKCVFVSSEADSSLLNWVKNIPHTYDEDEERLLIATSKSETVDLLKTLSKTYARRKLDVQSDNTYGEKEQQIPLYVFFITAPHLLNKNNPMAEYMFKNKEMQLGISSFFVVNNITQLPPECEIIIETKDNNGEVYNTNNMSCRTQFTIDVTSDDAFGKFGSKLMKVRSDDSDNNSSFPDNYTFFDMLGVKRASDIDLKSRWSSTNICESMSAPLGIRMQNELLYLDMYEEAHGPHGLVGGTTGSGKSEALLSYVLSLATLYHPYEIGFVIIDFKGDGMGGKLSNLPHLIGKITNIDGNENEITRSLLSIKAESLRRQKVLAEAKVKNIDEYLEKYKEKQVSLPLPHLILIVDEFAELKDQQPEFIKELISTARIGRSLGMHLILSTQNPATAISEDIMTNSKFKLCFKMNNPENSNAVIKSPLASKIKEAGRGYLKVGDGEIFELFQSGYSGARIDNSKETQLDAVINHIIEYCNNNNILPLPSICMPPLEKEIPYVKSDNDLDGISLGIYDNPNAQCQDTFVIDVELQNTVVIGSTQYGKTNALQLAIRGLCDKYTPNELNIYIIDFASGFLCNYENLNYVGGVVTALEDEKLKNLIKLIYNEIEKRKERFMQLGVSSYSSYKESGQTDLCQIVLIIDNFAALNDRYFQGEDTLLTLCQNGLTYGISIVIANPHARHFSKYSDSFSNKIALYCNDSSEYNNLFPDYCRMKINDIRGRCIVQYNNMYLECQMYLAFAAEKEFERAQEIKKYIKAKNLANANMFAIKIPEIPAILNEEYVKNNFSQCLADKGSMVLGMDYETVEPFVFDFKSNNVVAFSGKNQAVSLSFVKYIVKMFEQFQLDSTEFYIFDNIERKLSDLQNMSNVQSYEFMPSRAVEIITSIEKRLKDEYDKLLSGNSESVYSSKVIVIIINNQDVVESISQDSTALNAYKNIIGKYKNMNACFLFSNLENANLTYNAPEMIKKIKDERTMFFFGDLNDLKVFDLQYSTIKNFKKQIDEGDCYFIKGNNCIKIKYAKCDNPM